ncbi:MAG: DUF2970 domain-containing protein [Betaproteobacteria bacterium]|jgi:hypothetical protein
MNTPGDGQDLQHALARKGSLLQTFKAVAWSFLGIRRSDGYARDVSQLNPVHVIAAGLLAAALFVLGVWWLVNWIVASGVAQI